MNSGRISSIGHVTSLRQAPSNSVGATGRQKIWLKGIVVLRYQKGGEDYSYTCPRRRRLAVESDQ